MAEVTPVTVLTGFPGAGKTTLLNHLLRQPALARTAVLVSQSGETGIDRRLVRVIDDGVVPLNTGCLCCTVRGGLTRGLREMLPKARLGEIARVIVAASGDAEPAPILTALMIDPAVASAYRLDSVIAVIDAVDGETNLREHGTAIRQVAMADQIVLTKTDLADPAGVLDRIARLNPDAPVVIARHGSIDTTTIPLVALFDPGARTPAAATNGPLHHDRGSGVASLRLSSGAPLAWPAVERWLRDLIAAHGEKLLRIKGILHLAGQDRPTVIHGVRHLLLPPSALPAWPADDPRDSRILLITQDLPPAILEETAQKFVAIISG